MATSAVTTPPTPPLAGARRCIRGRGVFHRRLAASPMKDEPVISTNGGNEEMVINSLNVARGLSRPGLSSSLSNKASVVPTPLLPNEPSDLRFNRLQPSIDESDCKYKRLFGCYVAREALIDEEYWIAAWLRAEDHYEDQSGNRYVESFKRKFASQEFHALKKRCSKQHGEKYICVVAVKNDDLKRTVLNSVVGTLDVCVRHPLHGEKFPEEPGSGRSSLHCRIYQPDQPKFGYLTNVCVAKYARRQGIASNMLLLATIDAARLNGAENIYIHVHKDNLPAWKLYNQIGFKRNATGPRDLEKQEGVRQGIPLPNLVHDESCFHKFLSFEIVTKSVTVLMPQNVVVSEYFKGFCHCIVSEAFFFLFLFSLRD